MDTPIEVVENVQTDYPQKKSKSKIENKTEVIEDIDEKNDVEEVDELDLLIENDDIDEDIDNDGIDTGESLMNENREEILDSYDENDDEYEEIIFQDDFDKEYWSGTDDNYLEN